ncbi:hypothetical protein DFH06DRAFT_1140698 [Mycena polygramma]|nr:hypothetical protein DFH06DRAFT_1140698 [Mycena polygramma]
MPLLPLLPIIQYSRLPMNRNGLHPLMLLVELLTPEGGAYPRQARDYVKEVVQLLKTASPLLVLSLETIVDQVAGKFKSSNEEDTCLYLCQSAYDDNSESFRGNIERTGDQKLIAQGLRTLELCIDNLTPDFLDPTLSTVLRELMETLHSRNVEATFVSSLEGIFDALYMTEPSELRDRAEEYLLKLSQIVLDMEHKNNVNRLKRRDSSSSPSSITSLITLVEKPERNDKIGSLRGRERFGRRRGTTGEIGRVDSSYSTHVP